MYQYFGSPKAQDYRPSAAAKLMCAIIHVVHASNLPGVTVLGDLNKN